MKLLRSNPYNSAALAVILAVITFHCFEAFDNTLHSEWLRQNIHLFTPVIPGILILIGVARKEYYLLPVINILLIAGHYYFIKVLNDIGRAGAGVIQLL